jgi:hypothetical protein
MKIFKLILFIITSIVFVLLSITIFKIDNVEAFSNISTFLSITTGFNITALSIIATSNFAKHLYTIEDENDNSKTLLHTLVNKFKSATFLFITCISFILIYSFFGKVPFAWEKMHLGSYSFYFRDIISSLVWYTTFLSIISFVSLLFLFSRFVVKNASN